jgi:RNA-directed DNA polymerase
VRPAESQATTATQLTRIAWLSARDTQKTFQSLMHHFNETSLKACFHQLDGRKAVGVDGVTKAAYAQHLDDNLTDLVARMKRMAYRPGPVRQVLIPKAGAPHATRPLGISNLEDKVVQLMMHRVLESIYEPLFLDCSYGFRLGRGCHEALRALHQHLYRQEVEPSLIWISPTTSARLITAYWKPCCARKSRTNKPRHDLRYTGVHLSRPYRPVQ